MNQDQNLTLVSVNFWNQEEEEEEERERWVVVRMRFYGDEGGLYRGRGMKESTRYELDSAVGTTVEICPRVLTRTDGVLCSLIDVLVPGLLVRSQQKQYLL